jgi:hypothetical protein
MKASATSDAAKRGQVPIRLHPVLARREGLGRGNRSKRAPSRRELAALSLGRVGGAGRGGSTRGRPEPISLRMTRSRFEKVDLLEALRLVAAEPAATSGELVCCLMEAFSCQLRAAQDALAVLKGAGYLSIQPDRSDARLRRYALSERGERLFDHPEARLLLSFARKLFTSCPSRRRPPGMQAARESGELAQRLEQYERFLLVVPAAARAAVAAGSLPAEAAARNGQRRRAAGPALELIVERRCKVCRSEQRREIDLMLASGFSHASLRDRFNQLLGEPFFTAKNIAGHHRDHLNQADPAVRKILDARLQAEQLAQGVDYLEATLIRQAGLEALQFGLTQVRPRDMLAAIRAQDEPQAANADVSLEEMRFEFDAFMAAVQEVAPQHWKQVMDGFERNLAEAAELTAWNERERLLHPPSRQRPAGT